MLGRMLVTIHAARPGMTLRARAVVEAVLLAQGPIGSAEHVARMLGLKNRFRLARLLQSEGLPPLHRLTEWVTVLGWLEVAERERVSLCWMAFHSHRHPSACYRLVKKVTGQGWEDVQQLGEEWVLRQFLRELRRWGRGRRLERERPPVSAEGPKDCRPELARRMVEATQHADKVATYSGFEKTRIRDHSKQYPSSSRSVRHWNTS